MGSRADFYVLLNLRIEGEYTLYVCFYRTQAVDEPTLLQMLPDRLRSEIAINVHLDTLKKVP